MTKMNEYDVFAFRLVHEKSNTKGPWSFVQETSENICVWISLPADEVKDGESTHFQYDSYEAYHLDEWAKSLDKGITIERYFQKIELPE